MMLPVILILTSLSLPAPGSADILTTVAQQLASILTTSATDTTDGAASTGVTTLSSQCSTLKTLLMLQYEQMQKNGNEPDVSKLTLNYMTKNSFESYNLSTAAEEIPKSSWFDADQDLIIYVHGFTANPNGSNYKNVSESFFARGEHNILALDCSSLIGYFYARSTTYVIFIGQALGRVIQAFVNAGTKATSIHLIGHSLGAHICSFAGKTAYNLTGEKVNRISGLDPAGPCFTNVTSDLRLNSSDAAFVDVIHTNAGVFGLDKDIGHVDFWPNGGTSQPGCTLYDCSHGRVVYLFAESILSNNFTAFACSSWNNFRTGKCNDTITSIMGYGASNSTRGRFYLQTGSSYP